MASIITADGYALTAAHVVGRPSLTSCFFINYPQQSRMTPIHLSQLRSIPKRGQKQFTHRQWLRYDQLEATPRTVKWPGPARLEARIVKVFPHHDLALLKLPLVNAAFFDLPPERLIRKTTLFMAGNLMAVTPGKSAGELKGIRSSQNGNLTLFTTIPTAAGDSGGPVVNESGLLAGVVSRGWAHRFFPLLPVSTLTSSDTRVIKALIKSDRGGH